MNDGRKVCLDLFCGLGGFSAAFEDADGWDVVTVDIEDRFDPDLRADVLDLRPADVLDVLPVDAWDDIDVFVVLASPPCTVFSTATRKYHWSDDWYPETERAVEGLNVAFQALYLIQQMDPEWWFLENPQGYLQRFIGEPEGIVHYCQYGETSKKPTQLWGEHPGSMEYLKCDCHSHDRDLDTEMQWEQSKNDYAERAKVPYELSTSILAAVEEPRPRLEQQTIDDMGH